METRLSDAPANPKTDSATQTTVLWRSGPPEVSGDHEIIEVHPIAIVCLSALLVGMLMTIVFVAWLFWPVVMGNGKPSSRPLTPQQNVMPVAANPAASGKKPSSMAAKPVPRQNAR